MTLLLQEVTKRMKKEKTYQIVRCGLFTALVAVGAYIQIPVPYMDYFTLQFLFVLLAGMILGSAGGATAVGAYVLLGLFGVPIFAAGGGIQYVLRPSFGYLLGFIAAAFVVGKAVELQKGPGFGGFLISALCGFVTTYVIGLAYKYLILNLYLGTPTPLWVVLASCFPLDMPGDLVLSVFASLLAVRVLPILKRYHYAA